MENNEIKFELAESREAIDLVPTWELEWWWIVVPALGLVLLILLGYVFLKQTKVFDPKKAKREAFQQALSELAKLDVSLGKENVIMVSLVLREYLSKCMNDPTLYETHEEFVGRHDAIQGLDEELREEISVYFSELAASKYAPEEGQVPDVEILKNGAVKLLERIHLHD
jgi:hypothetical protein